MCWPITGKWLFSLDYLKPLGFVAGIAKGVKNTLFISILEMKYCIWNSSRTIRMFEKVCLCTPLQDFLTPIMLGGIVKGLVKIKFLYQVLFLSASVNITYSYSYYTSFVILLAALFLCLINNNKCPVQI